MKAKLTYKLGFWVVSVLFVVTLALGVVAAYRLDQADQGDLNHDGKVSVSDLAILAKHYGKKDQGDL